MKYQTFMLIKFLVLSVLITVSLSTDCPLGQYYLENYGCQKCGENCAHCTGENDCIKCLHDYGVIQGECVTQCPEYWYANLHREAHRCIEIEYTPFTTVWNQDEDLQENFFGIDVQVDIVEFSFCMWFKVLNDYAGVDLLAFTRHNSFRGDDYESSKYFSFQGYFNSDSILIMDGKVYHTSRSQTQQANEWTRICVTMTAKEVKSYAYLNHAFETTEYPVETEFQTDVILPTGQSFIQLGPKFGFADAVRVKGLKLIRGKIYSRHDIFDGINMLLHYYLFNSNMMRDKIDDRNEPMENGLSVLEDKKGLHFERYSFYEMNFNLETDITIDFNMHLLAFPYQMIDGCQLFQIKNEANIILNVGLRYNDDKEIIEQRATLYGSSSRLKALTEIPHFSNKTFILKKNDNNQFVIYDNDYLAAFSPRFTIRFGSEVNIPSCNFYLSNLFIGEGAPGSYKLSTETCEEYDMRTDQCIQCPSSILNIQENTCEGKCPANCLNCFYSDICEICREGYLLDRGNCVLKCPSNEVLIGTQCVPLIPHCAMYNNMKCESCEKGFETHQLGCIPICKDSHCAAWKQAKEEFACSECPIDNCKVYLEDLKCLICNPGWYNHKGQCVKNCPQGVDKIHESACVEECPNGNYFDQKTETCKKCAPECLECGGPFTCYKCNHKFFNYEHSCYKNCPDQTYISDDGKSCKQCPSECDNCIFSYSNNKVECIACDKSKLLTNKGCLDQCPANAIYKYEYKKDHHQCVQDCPPNSFKNIETKVCFKCPEDCITCSSSEVCEICDEVEKSMILFHGKCLIQCPRGYYRAGKLCESCENCETCLRDGCLLCKEGYEFSEQNICVPSSSFFLNIVLILVLGAASFYLGFKIYINCKEKLIRGVKSLSKSEGRIKLHDDDDQGLARNTQIELS